MVVASYWGSYQTREAAMKRSKALALLIANRVQHRTWVLTQRKAVLSLLFMP